MNILKSNLILYPGVAVNIYPSSSIYQDLEMITDSLIGMQVIKSNYGCLATVDKRKGYYIVIGKSRFKVIDQEIITIKDEIDATDLEFKGMERLFKSKVAIFAELLREVSPDLGKELLSIVNSKSGLEILFLFVFLMDYSKQDKLKILENEDLKDCIGIGLTWIDDTLKDFRVSIEKLKSRHHKKEKNRTVIQDESNSEVQDLREKIKKLKLSNTALKSIEKDLSRMSRMNSNNADYHVIYSYLEIVVDLPWDKFTENLDLNVAQAQSILNQDHQGLEKVKRRILEYIAVFQMTKTLKGPILCLVGPPGTGKTSLGKSIARALDRKFYRIALGGVRDEAQIRGHRRTYIGALPGLIIQSLRKVGVNNPVFLLDEIDKLGTDGRSDPSSALLEVLDPEQNESFTDSYLNLPFDLSKTVFIATANDLNQIPEPLKDRMEIIKIPSYTQAEKLTIAKTHLISKQLSAHGLSYVYHSKFQDDLIHFIIQSYTNEAGVRELERHIAALCRFIAIESKTNCILSFQKEDIEKVLGPPISQNVNRTNTQTVGLATGLAWTTSGGKILYIESTSMNGSGRLVLTGTLGETMKESAHIALSWIKSNQFQFPNISKFPFKDRDFHLHVPSGGTPKDGPSAGITILLSLLSHIIKRPIIQSLAMTGEITLLGEILPVGGIRDKVLAATSMKISSLMLPKGNQKDFHLLPVMSNVSVSFVDNVYSAIKVAFPNIGDLESEAVLSKL